jgi:dTDP-4-amino-4,6-dideoxygalactose transaminase
VNNSEQFLPVAKPWLDERDVEAARRAILSGWVTQGPEVAAFEREFASYVGSTYACAVSNCTTALHLALSALDVGPGDEVITVSHSFIATANAIRYCGAKPVFVDIQLDTYNIDPNLIEHAITERTKAILCVHQIGMPCDLNSIIPMARRHSLPVIEDAACAIGSEILMNNVWDRIGKPHGEIACFSFHPRKLVSTGDGGMLTTSNTQWDRQFRLWRQHCMNVPDSTRHRAKEVIFEEYPQLGYNYRMTDIQAAIGREQLRRLPEMIARRRDLVTLYAQLLADIEEIILPSQPEWARSNWQSLCIRLAEGLDQKEIMQKMLDLGIATRRGVMCIHREQAYPANSWSCDSPASHGRHQFNCSRLQVSERAQDQTIILPLFHEMAEGDVRRVVRALKEALRVCMKQGAQK